MKKTLLAMALLGSIGNTTFTPNAAERDQSGQAVYFGLSQRNDGKVELKFVFSKSPDETHKFSPTHAFLIVPDIQQKKCGTQTTQDLEVPSEYMSSPIYDFSDEAKQLPAEKIPIFFAVLVSAELARKGFAKNPEDSLPYHTCTRLAWTQLLGLN